jgi:hypothetical protein
MPGRVGDDELPSGGGEVAVRHVDGDALLALRFEAVRDQREVQLGAAGRAALAGTGERRKLVGEDAPGVVEQPADQGALAVVDAAGGDEPENAAISDAGQGWWRTGRGGQFSVASRLVGRT